ncbi:MAG: hypothetical protein OXN18_12150 [Gemmatimonadota bacterium]|nr:hypothetical protein [Gemmatimonadota bacterium]
MSSGSGGGPADPVGDEAGPRLSGRWVLKQVLGRALLPHHVFRWLRRRRVYRRVPTVHANAQLALYNRMLPGDFLHYGYFNDPDTPPETISFATFHHAQRRYAELLLDLIEQPDAPIPDAPILDAGCGMGGMLGLLGTAGYDVTGLTPDRIQAAHIRNTYPGIPILRCRFEDIDVDKYSGYFGTIIHAESLQYMDADGVFAVMDKIIAQSGTWIVADYFRVGNAGPNRSGWRLDAFRARLGEHGYTVAHEADITANVLPTLGFARLLADRIGLPALDFAHDKLRAKNPALHYVLENVAERARDAAVRSAAVIDPARFAADKRYVLMKIRKT